MEKCPKFCPPLFVELTFFYSITHGHVRAEILMIHIELIYGKNITCFYRILAHSVHRNLTHWVFLWKVYSILLEIRSTYLENILPYKHTTSCEKSPWMLPPTICTFEMLIVILWFICSISSKKKYLNFFFMARNNRNLIDPSQFIFSWYLFFCRKTTNSSSKRPRSTVRSLSCTEAASTSEVNESFQ